MPAAVDLRDRLAEVTLRDEHRLARRLERARRQREPEARERELAKLAAEVERAEARIAARRAAVPDVSYPAELPVSARRADLLDAIRDHQVVVVAGETGSGKTTQLPKICLELGRGVRGVIAHTQPRRLAARTVAARIADELKVPLGGAVGYSVRFNDRSGEDTLVRLVTDGLLLAEIQHDRLLRRYDTIIVDEAHERSLNIDFLLGYLKRLLPQRPDLKVIITSATIDPQQFSRHFGDAPVVEVSGRTYPVEVRYRPLTVPRPEGSRPLERDPIDAIGDAVDELLSRSHGGGPGDILVFLSGEREIRDTADVLRGRFSDLDVLPLYARLSTAEQQRAFTPHDGRRVVLATNVAETSVTVPGIRYVVDPGTARISRYSARLKVQRLPIEPVSQASADQRKGRCGRIAEGVCIRLYGEQDFEERPRFTDPEILRTNLASVILQMASLGLGDIEAFPFLDPPDRRQVRDGVNLLHELGALERRATSGDDAPPGDGADGVRLTPLGRRLAQLPVDPRMGRMVLEADRLDCAEEVIVIAAALSIQDPRERPSEEQAQADQLHARFKDDNSDFVAYLNLWRYLREQQRELSGNQFRKRCKAEYLHFLRIREWQDLVGQLRQAARSAGVKLNAAPAEPDQIHIALLSGLLSHIGVKDGATREYAGARGARFQLFPGSALARKPPAWAMVAELVETSRLWGRTAARIQPQWIEPLAEHLVKRTYSEPRWDRKRGQVVATERVTLYGLPVVTGRRMSYAKLDPAGAHELFLRRALVERDWDTRHAFFAENARMLDEVRKLEDRLRRRDLLVGDEALFAFFDARIPQKVVSAAHFDRWWRDEQRRHPDLLTTTLDVLLDPAAAAALDAAGRPDTWRQGEVELPLTYAFEPGSARDGVTAHVPLKALPRVRAASFEWLVPAFRAELVTTLIRGLPKEVRRELVPVPETAEAVLAALGGGAGAPNTGEPLAEALSAQLERLRGVRVAPSDFDFAKLPPHLRMTFRVQDDAGAVVAEGQDLEALREQARPLLRERLAAATRALERHGATAWDFGAIPKAVALPGTGQAVRAYPALVDEGDTVGMRAFDTREAQRVAMRAGTRRLLRLTVASPERGVRQKLSNAAQLTLATAPHGSLGAVLDDAVGAALDSLIDEAGGPVFNAEDFTRLRAQVAGQLPQRTAAIVALAIQVLDARADLHRRLQDLIAPPLRDARQDVAAQLGRLVFPGFLSASGAAHLADVVRYLRAAERRLERLPDGIAADRDRMRAIHELEAEHQARVAAWPAGHPLPPPLVEAGWLLEELRVSQLAGGANARPVSAKRIRKLLADVER